MIRVAIVTIGDEILIGQIVDTNSAWLGVKLNEMGVSVERILSIKDTRDDIFTTLRDCLNKYDLTLVTGGLGPTKDDITKKTLGEMFNCGFVQHQESHANTQAILDRAKIQMNELNRQQSFVPECCEVILNSHGTAPGMVFSSDSRILISMPGVPFEMKQMCEDSVFELIKNNYKLKSNIHRSIVTYGAAESILADKLEQWESDLPEYLHLAYLPNPNRVRLRLSAYDVENNELVSDEIDRLFVEIQQIIPEYYIGTEHTELEVGLGDVLKQRGETISVAESCTGGNIATKLTKYDGSSEFFMGGIIAYSDRIKVDILGVSSHDIEQYGAVSCQVVEQMARAVRKLMETTYSIATSGIAGSGGGTPEKPVGTVWIAIDTPFGTFSRLHLFSKLREPNIEKSSSQGLSMLLNHIKGLLLSE